MRPGRTIRTSVAAGALILVAIGTFTVTAGAGGRQAKAMLRDTGGQVVGVVHLTTGGDGKISVRVSAHGLAPGFHGFHIHSVGTCDASAAFVSAGGHFNPMSLAHGDHAGDQPVLLVNTDGTAVARFASDRYDIEDLFDTDGSAFIVHAGPDNYANIPASYSSGGVDGPNAATLATGDAGARSACGAITP